MQLHWVIIITLNIDAAARDIIITLNIDAAALVTCISLYIFS